MKIKNLVKYKFLDLEPLRILTHTSQMKEENSSLKIRGAHPLLGRMRRTRSRWRMEQVAVA